MIFKFLQKETSFIPYNSFFIRKDNHKVFCQEFGNVEGKPILIFHGGPGDAFNKKILKSFNLRKCRIITFDQRGCGKSQPFGEIKNNNIYHIISDARSILDKLNIKKVIVFGNSWGATLALLFSEKYHKFIEKIYISSVFLARREDINWLFQDSLIFYPDFLKNTSNKNYNKLEAIKLIDNLYENILGSLNPRLDRKKLNIYERNHIKIFKHYFKNKFFIDENEILKNISTIQNIPTVIIHNRLDFITPLKQAWDLHNKLKKSKLIILPGLGHWNDILKNEQRKILKKI